MTNDTLNAHIKAYYAGTISIKDHQDMVEELVTRREHRERFKPLFKELNDGFKNAVLELIDDD